MIRAAVARGLKASANLWLVILRRLVWRTNTKKIPHSICIHRVGQIGDLVCAIPAIRAIRAAYPQARLVLLTSPGSSTNPVARQLASAFPWVDKVWIYYSDEVRSTVRLLALLRDLRRENFDLWIALPQDLTTLRTEVRNTVFARLVGARHAIGFRLNTIRLYARQQFLVEKKIPREADLLLQNLVTLGVPVTGGSMSLTLSQEDKVWAESLLQKSNVRAHLLLALVPGGNRPANRWPIASFTEIARRWCECGGHVLVLGGMADRSLAESIIAPLMGTAVSVCGEATLMQTAAILNRSQVVLCNDTGPMHLAAALGRPCIVPFSARDFPGKWYPWGSIHAVLRRDIGCSPCFLDVCPIDNRCLTDISVEEVWAALTPFIPLAGKIAE